MLESLDDELIADLDRFRKVKDVQQLGRGGIVILCFAVVVVLILSTYTVDANKTRLDFVSISIRLVLANGILGSILGLLLAALPYKQMPYLLKLRLSIPLGIFISLCCISIITIFYLTPVVGL